MTRASTTSPLMAAGAAGDDCSAATISGVMQRLRLAQRWSALQRFLDFGPSQDRPHDEDGVQSPWDEHGWSLTGPQLAAVLAALAGLSAVLR